MTSTLPDLQNGHAPITLQYLFRDALHEFEDWGIFVQEPRVSFGQHAVRISEVFEALKGCSDIVPANIVGSVADRLTKPWEGEGPLDEMAFSTAARVMSVLVRKRLLEDQRSELDPSQLKAAIPPYVGDAAQ
ncbi:hypothetical protein [Aliirhizobium smilacinae]|uniref:Uncharacterized protein n=1 Tax=Aliirhizobium smilacinae TaxID=1395944 RepID=A0A5C4XEA1_9HYPH|nr:hypothetical protein [Rhizobium smilacinae]TNM61843.1 hypothetical protein FHP24_21560 [Rhizobium smilacinae]